MSRSPFFVLVLSMVAATACVGRSDEPTPRLAERPLIASVVVDKPTPCVGDDVVVTARPAAGAAGLTVSIGGEPGRVRVLPVTRSGRQRLDVTARAGAEVQYTSAEIVASDCPPRPLPALEIAHQGATGDPDAVRFDAGGDQAIRYLWDFGDGTFLDSADRSISKSYALRPQDAPESTFVVTVTAIGADGRSATRLHSVTLENPSFVAPGAEQITLAADYGHVVRHGRSPLRIRNPSPDAVTLSSARVHLVGCDGTARREVDVTLRQLFARPPEVLPPGQVWSGELLVPGSLVAGACRADVTLTGKDGAGRAAQLPLVLELGIPSSAVVVRDRELLTKIARARQILGRRDVTHDELDTLERAGRLGR